MVSEKEDVGTRERVAGERVVGLGLWVTGF